VVLARDNTDDEWDLLEPRLELFARARKSVKKMQDTDIQQQTVDWLDRAQKLRGERNKVVHSVVHYNGRLGWSGFDPRSRDLQRMKTGEIVELAEQARKHADEGVYLSVAEWPRALGVEPEEVEPDD
jgi:hypothetical protein